jgi:hypothetical protein
MNVFGARPSLAVTAKQAPDRTFRVSTRRGTQFNSTIQRQVDPLTGARRDAVFIPHLSA